MSSIATSNLTSGFIDLATFDELEKYMYGGPDATAYFVRETRKATWFTQVPVVLSRASGQPQFNQDWSVSISRAGDYLLQSWLRLQVPNITLASSVSALASNINIRWTRNLMHNLIRECAITFNDLVAARFDSYHLDFWAAFTTPASKQNGYNNMIGNIKELIEPVGPGQTLGLGGVNGGTILNLPLPLFYARDCGVSLPTAALPYNEMRINFTFRDWTDLLIYNTGSNDLTVNNQFTASTAQAYLTTTPVIQQCQVWSNYAIVSNDERKRMGCAPRDILVEQVQTAPLQSFVPYTTKQQSFDIRFSHAMKVLFFNVRNTTCKSEWSNYTCCSPTVSTNGVISFTPTGNAIGPGSTDPILQTSLTYENTNRLQQIGSDFFALVNPWYNAPTIPAVTGYHAYSYSLDFFCLDPLGSTNYGKLTNVSIVPEASDDAIAANAPVNALSKYNTGQTFQFILTGVNNNIVRVSGGALGENGKPRTGRCVRSCGKTSNDKHCNYHTLEFQEYITA